MAYIEKYSRDLRFAVAGFCFALSGCAGSVYHAESFGGFSDSALAAQAAGDGLQVQVDGNVGGVRGAALAAAVNSAMPESANGAPNHYAACEAYSECPGDHLVWTFGPPAARPASTYPPALAVNFNLIGSYRPDTNNITVKVAYIQNGEIVSTAAGQVNADSPNDAAFQGLIHRMAGAILSGPGLLYNLTP